MSIVRKRARVDASDASSIDWTPYDGTLEPMVICRCGRHFVSHVLISLRMVSRKRCPGCRSNWPWATPDLPAR